MAETNFHFPSSTGYYATPAGNIRIKIFYDDTSTTNTNVAAELEKIGPLDYEFSVDNTDGRFSQLKLTFLNIDNVFETYSIINSNKETETFVDIYNDGTLFWRGLLIPSETEKSDYYLDGMTPKYHKITLTVHDCAKYFWLNDITLSDVSYSDHMSLNTLLTSIVTNYLYYTSGDVSIDTNIGAIDEACGNSYNISDFYLNNFGSNMLVSTFLKYVMQLLGCDIYSLDTKFYFTSKIDGSTTTIQTADIVDGFSFIANDDKVNYVAVSAYKDWDDVVVGITNTHSDSQGTSTENGNSIELSGNDFLDRIFTTIGGINYFGDFITTLAESFSRTSLFDEDVNFYSEEIETGMVAGYNGSGSAIYSIIQTVEYASGVGSNITFIDHGAVSNDGYRIYRQPNESGTITIYKIELLVQRLVDLYWSLFSNNQVLKMSLIDIDTYKTIYNRYVFNSNNYRAKKASFDFDKNLVKLEMLEV